MLGLHYILPLDFCFARDVPLVSTTWLQMALNFAGREKISIHCRSWRDKISFIDKFFPSKSRQVLFAEDVVTFYSYL